MKGLNMYVHPPQKKLVSIIIRWNTGPTMLVSPRESFPDFTMARKWNLCLLKCIQKEFLLIIMSKLSIYFTLDLI